ncbi:hypothetical protein LTR37_013601 [Vermiconidia calcicola]|uniref:Uncharacterized protein n=1 Tax=Vermiconidia calcicola TaxID=1690605 RepID=A0ACC3MW66_9PEZI|nr:hypothetical protein LTR37_013601 [Vermiconidia calcicola]
MSANENWQDRRGIFQRGKELHAPGSPTSKKFHETGAVSNAVRKSSVSSTGSGGGGGGSPVEKSSSGSFPTSSGRRRSSAASGLFGNLTTAKRGSEDYGERRASTAEMSHGSGGFVSGWYNSTFKGHPKSAENKPQNQDSKKGIME